MSRNLVTPWSMLRGVLTADPYDPDPVEGDAFDMANMKEAADAKILTAAERAAIGTISSASILVAWFEYVGVTTSGTLTAPAGGTIKLNRWADGVDALASGVGVDNRPDFSPVRDSSGVVVTATLDGAGNWTLSATPTANTVIVYCYAISPGSVNDAYVLPGIEFGEAVDYDDIAGNLTLTATTTDATPTEASAGTTYLGVPTGMALRFVADVLGTKDTDGSEYIMGEVKGAAINPAGTAALLGEVTPITDDLSDDALAFTAGVTGGRVTFTVTGLAGTNMTWTLRVRSYAHAL